MTNFRNGMIAMAAAAAMAGSLMPSSLAIAADGTLAPGKPAGMHQAARHSPNLLLIGGAAALVIGGVAVAISQGSNSQCTSACTVVTATTT
jgi:hypothetical protein